LFVFSHKTLYPAVMSTNWDMYDSFCNKSDVIGNTAVFDHGNKADVPDSSSMSNLDLNPKGPEQSMSMVSISSTGNYFL